MSEKSIENITKSDCLFSSISVNHYVLPDVNFNGHCLINDDISIPRKIINLNISYPLNPWLRDWNRDYFFILFLNFH